MSSVGPFSFCLHSFPVSTTNWHLPKALPVMEPQGICCLPLWRLNPVLHSCCPSTTPEGAQGGVRQSAPQGLWWDRSLGRWVFLGTDGRQWKQCQTLFVGGSKITADGDCSHEIKTRLLLGRRVMTNLDSILKRRDIILSTKVCLVKAMVFLWSCMDVRVGL